MIFSKSFLSALDLSSSCVGVPTNLCQKFRKKAASQWEALQTDASGTLFVLQEFSSSIFILSPDMLVMQGAIHLDLQSVPNSDRKNADRPGRWASLADSSAGEGFVLLRGGKILLAKEKLPSVIIEFGSEQIHFDAKLLHKDVEFLGDDEVFEQPSESSLFKALNRWTVRGREQCDISELATYSDRLYALSQSCGEIWKLSSLVSGERTVAVDQIWRLPHRVKGAEGLVVLQANQFVVGRDRKGDGNNLYILSGK